MYRIVIDAMGGDHAPQAVIEGALAAVAEAKDIEITLVGKEDEIRKYLPQNAERFHIVHAEEMISMDEAPVAAIRKKKNSSIVVGMNLVKDGEADVFLSAGSSGAIIAGATLIIRRARNVERAALAPLLPTIGGKWVMLLDAGANVDCKPAHLLQFARMGSIYMETILGIGNPRIGLLNNGAEAEKGCALTKEVYGMLQESELNFVGNIEPRDALADDCDVLVADGFAGNVLMKSIEGTVKMLLSLMKQSLYSSLKSKIGALLCKDAFGTMKKRLDYKEYGGALLLGVNGGIVKAHGSSDARAIKNAVLQARKIAESKVVARIAEKLEAQRATE